MWILFFNIIFYFIFSSPQVWHHQGEQYYKISFKILNVHEVKSNYTKNACTPYTCQNACHSRKTFYRSHTPVLLLVTYTHPAGPAVQFHLAR